MTREEQKLQAAIAAAMNLPKEEEPDAPIFPTAPVNQAAPVQPQAQPQVAPQAAQAPQQQPVQQQPFQQAAPVPQQAAPVQQQVAPAQVATPEAAVAPEAMAAEGAETNSEEERDWDAVEQELNASIDKRGKKRKAKSVTVNVVAYAALVAVAAYGFLWYSGSEENQAKVAGLFQDVKAVKNDLNPKKIVDSYKESLAQIEEHQKKIQGAGSFLAGEDEMPEDLKDATAQMKEQIMQMQEAEAAPADAAPEIKIMPVSR